MVNLVSPLSYLIINCLLVFDWIVGFFWVVWLPEAVIRLCVWWPASDRGRCRCRGRRRGRSRRPSSGWGRTSAGRSRSSCTGRRPAAAPVRSGTCGGIAVAGSANASGGSSRPDRAFRDVELPAHLPSCHPGHGNNNECHQSSSSLATHAWTPWSQLQRLSTPVKLQRCRHLEKVHWLRHARTQRPGYLLHADALAPQTRCENYA